MVRDALYGGSVLVVLGVAAACVCVCAELRAARSPRPSQNMVAEDVTGEKRARRNGVCDGGRQALHARQLRAVDEGLVYACVGRDGRHVFV